MRRSKLHVAAALLFAVLVTLSARVALAQQVVIQKDFTVTGSGRVTPGTYNTGTWYGFNGQPAPLGGSVIRFNKDNTYDVNSNYLGGNKVCPTCYEFTRVPAPGTSLGQPVSPQQAAFENVVESPYQQPAQSFFDQFSLSSPNFGSFISRALTDVTRAFGSFFRAAGLVPGAGVVSRYKQADPTYLGYGRPGGYDPNRRFYTPPQGQRADAPDPDFLHLKRFSQERNPDLFAEGSPGGGGICSTDPGARFWVGYPRIGFPAFPAHNTAQQQIQDTFSDLNTGENRILGGDIYRGDLLRNVRVDTRRIGDQTTADRVDALLRQLEAEQDPVKQAEIRGQLTTTLEGRIDSPDLHNTGTRLENLIQRAKGKAQGNLQPRFSLPGLDSLANLQSLSALSGLADLSRLSRFPGYGRLNNLQQLSRLTDLSYLSVLQGLSFLRTNQNLVLTDATLLATLRRLADLSRLASLSQLANLSSLPNLGGLSQLSSLSELSLLSSLRNISDLSSLRFLSGLQGLAGLRGLSGLNSLGNLPGFSFLGQLSQLQDLSRFSAFGGLSALANPHALGSVVPSLAQLGSLGQLGNLGQLGSQPANLNVLGLGRITALFQIGGFADFAGALGGFQASHKYDCFCRCNEPVFCPVGGIFKHIIYGGLVFPFNLFAWPCQVCFGPLNSQPQLIQKHDYYVGLHHHGASIPFGYPIQAPNASGYKECLRQATLSPGGGSPTTVYPGL